LVIDDITNYICQSVLNSDRDMQGRVSWSIGATDNRDSLQRERNAILGH
jgi:hypothetical protein